MNKALWYLAATVIVIGIVSAALGVWCMHQAFDKYYYTMNFRRDSGVIDELGGMDKLTAQGQYFSAWGALHLGVSGMAFGAGAIILSVSNRFAATSADRNTERPGA